MPHPASAQSWARRFVSRRTIPVLSRKNCLVHTKQARMDPPTALRPQPPFPRLQRSAEVMSLLSLESGRQSRRRHRRTRASMERILRWTRWRAKRRSRARRPPLRPRQTSRLSTSTPTNRAAARLTIPRQGAAAAGVHLLLQAPMGRPLAATRACSHYWIAAMLRFPKNEVPRPCEPRAQQVSSFPTRFLYQMLRKRSKSLTKAALPVVRQTAPFARFKVRSTEQPNRSVNSRSPKSNSQRSWLLSEASEG